MNFDEIVNQQTNKLIINELKQRILMESVIAQNMLLFYLFTSNLCDTTFW